MFEARTHCDVSGEWPAGNWQSAALPVSEERAEAFGEEVGQFVARYATPDKKNRLTREVLTDNSQ